MAGWLVRLVGWSGWWAGKRRAKHVRTKMVQNARNDDQSALALAVQVLARSVVNTSEQYNLLILLGFPAVCWPYARRGNSPV
jgi:hypothetical protein